MERAKTSLEDPLVLVAGDSAFVLFALPALVMRGLLPYLVELDDFLLCFCLYLYNIHINLNSEKPTKFEK